MPVDPNRVQAIFLAAVEHLNPGDRAAILNRECATDRELRQRVESLLRANDQPDRFLDQPVVGATNHYHGASPVQGEGRSADNSEIGKKEA
jgi:hypothetical protein